MKRILEGVIKSNKMQKTLVVEVVSMKEHPKYRKRYSVTNRYLVHDEKQEGKIGQKVSIVECRPLSSKKRWRVLYS